jgi:hypothetical protein
MRIQHLQYDLEKLVSNTHILVCECVATGVNTKTSKKIHSSFPASHFTERKSYQSMKLTASYCVSLTLLCAPLIHSATITGGTTAVTLASTFVSTLAQAGITPSAVPPGTLAGTTATFPITGGDTTAGIIDHSGGLSFTQGSNSATIENFVINLNSMLLTGELIANGGTPMMGVNFFNIGAGNTLTINSILANDLSTVFGVPNLTGVSVGVATVSPVTSAVPEPADFGLLICGISALIGISISQAIIRYKNPARRPM